jgi:dihydrofolate synthase/folylpolyglutamate synthase
MALMIPYRDALIYLYSFTDYEKRGFAAYAPEFYNLDRVRRLLALIGEPQRAFKAVHIAGTKGKGSTAAMIESVLRAGGYRTGLYTSPHLHTFRERIVVAGELIPEESVSGLVEEMQPLVAQVEDVTTFEIITCLAFAWFARQGVEWAVIEVGLGGRLDATNVLDPEVTVITPISYDHMAILGDTLAEIAAEKAGIIKPGLPVVSAPQPDEVLAVIRDVADRHGAPLTLLGRDWTWQLGAAGLDGQSFTVRNGGGDITRELFLPLLGEHQVANAAMAVAAIDLLEQGGLELPASALREGLRAVRWPGRLEILNREPLVIADGAHNGDSARKLVAALRAVGGIRRLTLVLGGSPDHLSSDLLGALLPAAARVIATQSSHPRAASAAWVQARAAELGFQVEVSESVAQALDLALTGAGPQDLICCTGSLFVAGEARAAWFARQGMPLPPSDPV